MKYSPTYHNGNKVISLWYPPAEDAWYYGSVETPEDAVHIYNFRGNPNLPRRHISQLYDLKPRKCHFGSGTDYGLVVWHTIDGRPGWNVAGEPLGKTSFFKLMEGILPNVP